MNATGRRRAFKKVVVLCNFSNFSNITVLAYNDDIIVQNNWAVWHAVQSYPYWFYLIFNRNRLQ